MIVSSANAPEETKDALTAAAPTDETLAQLSMPYAQQELTQVILAFKNSLDWMASDEDLARCAGQILPKRDDEPKKR